MSRNECCFCGRLEDVPYEYVEIAVKDADGVDAHASLCPGCRAAFAASLEKQKEEEERQKEKEEEAEAAEKEQKEYEAWKEQSALDIKARIKAWEDSD